MCGGVKKLKAVVILCVITILFITATMSLGYEFLIVNHFETPFGAGIGDLTYNADGYLYATEKTTFGYGNKVYKLDSENGEFVGFFEHPSEPVNQLKYITSCNGNVFVDHYPLLFNYVIYKIYPDDGTWTTFFEPDLELSGGMACDGTNLILTEEEYIYTISLYDQEETSRDKFITLDSYNGMTWDGEYLWAITSDTSNKAILHKIDSGIIIEKVALPSTMTNCRGLSYDGDCECFWTYVAGELSPYSKEIVQIKLISGQTATTTIPVTTTVSVTTTTSSPASTTTTSSRPCLAEELYGEHSEKTEILRYFRDNKLSKSPEGQEMIRLYYEWSPAIVTAMEEDEEFKEELKEMLGGVLWLIGGETE